MEETLLRFNEELVKLEKKIIYLGDNEDLGLSSNSLTDTLTTIWTPLAFDQRQVERIKRDQERIAFFSNLTSFLKEIKVSESYSFIDIIIRMYIKLWNSRERKLKLSVNLQLKE